MVEYKLRVDSVFVALSDSTRRDILERVADTPLTVNQIAVDYDMSIAAVSKHIKMLEAAGLITKRKSGRYVFIHSKPSGLTDARQYIAQYDQFTM
jgi:DNA-binding transcriptional ArsR family regulator